MPWTCHVFKTLLRNRELVEISIQSNWWTTEVRNHYKDYLTGTVPSVLAVIQRIFPRLQKKDGASTSATVSSSSYFSRADEKQVLSSSSLHSYIILIPCSCASFVALRELLCMYKARNRFVSV